MSTPQRNTPTGGEKPIPPKRSVSPNGNFVQMEKRPLKRLPRPPLPPVVPTDSAGNQWPRVTPGENPFLLKYRRTSGNSDAVKSPVEMAHSYNSLSVEKLEKVRGKLQPGNKTTVRLRSDVSKRPSTALHRMSASQLLPTTSTSASSSDPQAQRSPSKDANQPADLQAMRDLVFQKTASAKATSMANGDASLAPGDGQHRLSFRSVSHSLRSNPNGAPHATLSGRNSVPASPAHLEMNRNRLPSPPAVPHSPSEALKKTNPGTSSSRSDVMHVPMMGSALALGAPEQLEMGLTVATGRSQQIPNSSFQSLSEEAVRVAHPRYHQPSKSPETSLETPPQVRARDTARETSAADRDDAQSTRRELGQLGSATLVPSGGSMEQARRNSERADDQVRASHRIEDAGQNSDPHTQPQRLESAAVAFVNVAEEAVPPKEKFRRKQEWLQIPTLFYMFANIIELQELLQLRRVAEAKELRRQGRDDTNSLVSSWDGEREAQLVNLQNHISNSVFEIDGVLLNPFFASWSQKRVRCVVSDVIETWKSHGPESSEFDEASLNLVDTISADESVTVTYTFLFAFREWVGDLGNLIPMCVIYAVLAAVSLLCVVFLGVFACDHLVACIVLSAVLGVDVIVFYVLSMLVLHHNAYADATATFFREEALTLTKTVINQDADEPDNSFVDMQSAVWSSAMGTERGRGAGNVAHNDDDDDDGLPDERRHPTEGEEGYVSMIGKSMQPTNPALREQLEKDRQNALLMTSINYGKHQQNVQLHQEQLIRQRMDVSPLVKDIKDGAERGSQGRSASNRPAAQASAENNAALVAGLSADICITALIWCHDGSITASIISSLWQHNFLVFSGTLPVLDNVYHQGSERFKVFLFHADDFVEGSHELDTAMSWVREKRPVFFFSRDVRRFPIAVPVSARLEVPFTTRDLDTLLLSGIGVDEEVNPTPQATQPFKVPPYTLGRRLGGGAYGNVFEAEMEETGGKCAVKRMYLKDDEEDQDSGEAGPSNQLREIAQEVEIMSSLSHPNIVKYMFCERDDNCISIFMELCSGGSLTSLINDGELTDPAQVKRILKEIISAVAYLHNKRIVHRDLKPDNVLFRDGRAKVTDFGAAVLKRDRGDLRLVKGTFAYMAPEILCGEPYGKACDVWSIGCITAEVLCVDLPQRALGLPEMCEYYRKMDANSSLDIVCDVPTVRDFLCGCLQRSPGSRMSAGESLQHEMLRPESTALDHWMETVNEKRRQSSRSQRNRTLAMNGSAFDLNSEANDSLQSSQILTP